MKRKILSIIMALAMCLSLLPTTVFAASYSDTEGHWAESSIERWSEFGIIEGNGSGFAPNDTLTRGQMAMILCRLLNLPAAPSANFDDVSEDAWYADAINRCAAAGIMLGSNGKAMPNDPVTREQAMVMLARALGIEPVENPDLSAYADADQISDYAKGYVAALINAGIISGMTEDTVAPKDDINRASTVTILDRAISVYSNEDGATIDASGAKGGIILVVGENTTITNAPAGTVIIAAEGAEGLCVNGVTISDNQSYVVPEPQPTKPTTSRPSHSHSYNETTLKCSCGQYRSDVVATVNDTNGYTTLADAIAAATNDQTVTLLKDVDNSAVDTIIVEKNITLDLNGHTLTLANTDGKGNINVKNATFTLKDSTDTSKNGTGTGKIITATHTYRNENSSVNNKVLIAAVDGGNFIMESGLIDSASGIENNADNGQFAVGVMNTTSDTTASVTINGGKIKAGWYAVCGNGVATNGTGNITVNGGILESTTDYAIYHPQKGTTTINDGVVYGVAGGIHLNRGTLVVNGGTITSKGTGSTGNWDDGTGNSEAAAVNVHAKYGDATAEIKGGTLIAEENALLLASTDPHTGTIKVTGGTFSADPSTYVASGYTATENNGTWTVGAMTGSDIEGKVAAIGQTTYETLDAAITAAQNGDTIALLDNIGRNSILTITKTITLDLNGKTLSRNTSTGTAVTTVYVNNGNLTVKDTVGGGKITASLAAEKSRAVQVSDTAGGTLTLESGTFEGSTEATGEASGLFLGKDATFTMNGGTISGKAHAILGNGKDHDGTNITINNGTLTSADDVIYHPQAGTLTINGGTFNGVNSAVEMRAGTLNITGGTFTATADTYRCDANGDGSTTKGAAIAIAQHTTKKDITVTISGGTFTGTRAFNEANPQSNETSNVTLSITGGTFNGEVKSEGIAQNAKFISGGTFSTDPSAYLADNCGAKLTDGKYVVSSHAGHAAVNPTTNWETMTSTATCETCGYVNKTALAEADYFINTKADLDAFAAQVNNKGNSFNGKTVKLMADINLNNEAWTSIGQSDKYFLGTFDGNGKTIKNLTVTGPTTGDNSIGVGFFGWIGINSTVKNLTIDGAAITGSHYVGVVAGYNERGTISDCTVKNASIDAKCLSDDFCGDKVGGIVGFVVYENGCGTGVRSCSVESTTIHAGRDAGQIVGFCAEGETAVSNCTVSEVTVTGGNRDTNSTAEGHCTTSTEYIGGIIGRTN